MPCRRGGADDALGLQFGDLVVAQAQSGEHLAVVLSEERRGLSVESVGPGEMRTAGCCAWRWAFTGWSTCSKKPRTASCGSSDWRCGCITLATGTPAAQRVSTISSPRARCAPRGSGARRSRSWCRRRPSTLASSGSAAQSGLAERGDAVPPTARRWPPRSPPSSRRRPNSSSSLVRYRFCGAAVGPAVPGALQQRAVRGVLDDLLGGDVERGVDHRGLDPHTLAGAAPMRQRQQQRVERVHTGVRVADRVRFVRDSGRDGRSAR